MAQKPKFTSIVVKLGRCQEAIYLPSNVVIELMDKLRLLNKYSKVMHGDNFQREFLDNEESIERFLIKSDVLYDL